jgi:flavin reductase (DIM6/NTAB) family NADH-FMN oxidoreductase RutF
VATAEAMRAARRRWATGVAVVTTVAIEGEERRFRGVTVSAFVPLSLEPPLVLVGLDSGGSMATLTPAAGVFAVSILGRAHESQADRFSGYGPLPDGRFTGIAYELAETGCPVLRDALAWFDCRLLSAQAAGDHLLVIGEAVAIGLGADTDDPLLNYEGAYRRIEGA